MSNIVRSNVPPLTCGGPSIVVVVLLVRRVREHLGHKVVEKKLRNCSSSSPAPNILESTGHPCGRWLGGAPWWTPELSMFRAKWDLGKDVS